MIVGLGLCVIFLIMGEFNPVGFLVLPFLGMAFGVGLGFIPAIVTGFILALKKFKILHSFDYLKVGILGFFVTLLSLLPLLFISHSYTMADLSSSILLILVGSASAVIVGKWVLPKEGAKHEQY